MNWQSLILLFGLMGSPASGQVSFSSTGGDFEPKPARTIDAAMLELHLVLQDAQQSILCSHAWKGRITSGELNFDDVSLYLLKQFVAAARKQSFELPDFSEGLTEYLLTAIDAPSEDIAVGMLLSEYSSEAKTVIATYQSTLDAVKIVGAYGDETRNLNVARLFRCENLAPVFQEIESRNDD